MWQIRGELLLDNPFPNNCQDLQTIAWGGKGGSVLWLKDYVFKTWWIKNSKSFLSVPPIL